MPGRGAGRPRLALTKVQLRGLQLALAGVQRHSAYLEDPWKRLAGTARWLVVSTFGSAELAERESARVRRMHRVVKGTDDRGRPYSAGDPDLLRWVHLVFTDAFLAASRPSGAT